MWFALLGVRWLLWLCVLFLLVVVVSVLVFLISVGWSDDVGCSSDVCWLVLLSVWLVIVSVGCCEYVC